MTKRQKGVTLIELLIVVSLAGVIFLVINSLTIIILNTNSRSKQLAEMTQAKNDLQAELSSVVKWAKEVVVDDSQGKLTVQTFDEPLKTYVYIFQPPQKTITKNDQRLVSDQVIVKSFQINNYSSSGPASLEMIIELEHAKFSTIKDRLRLVVSQRQGEVTVGP